MNKRWISSLLALVMMCSLLFGSVPYAYAASDLTTSDSAIGLIKEQEGFTPVPHYDYSQWSVGYGSACNKGDYPEGISEKEADALLRADIAKFEITVNRFADKYGLTLTQNQFDALVSFTYNVGSGWVNDSEGAFRNAVVNGATGSDFIYAISRWCIAGSAVQTNLIRRRLAEANLYLNGVYSTGYPASYTYVIFNNNLADCTNAVRVQGYDSSESVSVLATPTKSGYHFLGWYTKANGGEPVCTLNASTAGLTLYGHWQEGDGKQGEDGLVTGVAANYILYANVSGEQIVYEQPDTNSKQIRTLDANEKITVTAEYVDTNGVRWGKISQGWICVDLAATELQPEELLETPLKVTVTASGVNLRSGPGTSYDRIGTTTKGQVLTIVGVQKDEYFTWGKYDGGWICLSYTDYETAKAEASGDAYKVTAIGTVINTNALNIRSGPDTSYSCVGTYSRGEQMYITIQKQVGGGVWYKTEKGWIYSYYVSTVAVEEGTIPDLKPEEPDETEPDDTEPDGSESGEKTYDVGTVVNCNTLRIRANAGLQYSQVGYLAQGTQVVITEYAKVNGGTWGKIDAGWIYMDYVQLEGTTGGSTATGSTFGVVVNCTKVNVRSNAGTQYSKVGELAQGTSVQILETATASNGALWARTSTGWVHTYYLQMTTTNTGTGSSGSPGSTGSDTTLSGTIGIVVNCAKVNVRSNAGTQYGKVGELAQGTTVQILETGKASNGATWARTATGWIHTYYLQITTSGTTSSSGTTSPSDTTTGDSGDTGSIDSDNSIVQMTGTVVNTDTLRIRSAAGIDNAIVGTLYRGDCVEIFETKIVNTSTWGRISNGWISLYYVQVDAQTSIEGATVMTVATDTLRIRASAGVDQKHIGNYYRGNQVVILEQTTVDGAAWGRTDLGWVAMEYLK